MESPTLSFEDWRSKAKAKLSQEQFAYVAAGAGEGDVPEENEGALGRWRLVPRVLSGLAEPNLSTDLLGTELQVPMMLAPVRGLDYVHQKGQELAAQAAAKCGVPVMLSNLASSTVERVGAILGQTPRYLQLYPCSDRDLIKSFLGRAEMAGYSGVVLTVDMQGHAIQYHGPQTAEYMAYGNEIYLSDPVFQTRLGHPVEKDRKGALDLIRRLREANFTWEDVEVIRGATKLPVILKGILSPDDAREAADHRASAIVVSNHGGRAMSGEVAAIDMLPEIAEALDAKFPILYDGGIRSGTDVLKALALGARTVLVGRAFVYALAAGGEDGVVSILRMMVKEIRSGLATCGCSAARDLNRTLVRHPR